MTNWIVCPECGEEQLANLAVNAGGGAQTTLTFHCGECGTKEMMMV